MTERYPLSTLTAAECIHFKVFLRRRIRHTVHGSSQQRKKQRCSPNIWMARKSSKPHSCRRYKTPPCQPLFRPVWRKKAPHRVNTSPAAKSSRLGGGFRTLLRKSADGTKISRRKRGVALLSPRRTQRTATPTAQGFAGLLRMATKTAI